MNLLSNKTQMNSQSSLYVSELPWYEMAWMASEKDLLLSNSSNSTAEYYIVNIISVDFLSQCSFYFYSKPIHSVWHMKI